MYQHPIAPMIALTLCLGIVFSITMLFPAQAQAASAANAENYFSGKAYQAFGLSSVNSAGSQPGDFIKNVEEPLAGYTPMGLSELYVASMNQNAAYSGEAQIKKGPENFSNDSIKLENMKPVSSLPYSSGNHYQAQNATAVSYDSPRDQSAAEGIAESVLYSEGGNSYQKITLYDSGMKKLDSLIIPISDKTSGDWVKGIEADGARGLTAITAGRYYDDLPCIAAYVPARTASNGSKDGPYIMIASVDSQKIKIRQKINLRDLSQDSKQNSFSDTRYKDWYLPVVDLHTTGIAGYDDLVINASLPFAEIYKGRSQSGASVIYSSKNKKAIGASKFVMGRLYDIPMNAGTCARFAAACDTDLNGNGAGELVVAAHKSKTGGKGKGTMDTEKNVVQMVTWNPVKKEYQYVWPYAKDVSKIKGICVEKEITEPAAVTAGRYFEGDNQDYLFVEGVTYRFKGAFPAAAETEADYFRNSSLEESHRMSLHGKGNLFVSHAVTACFAKDKYGTEQTAVVSGVAGKSDSRVSYDISWVHTDGASGSLTQTESNTGYLTNKEISGSGTFLTLTNVDVDNDSVFFKYKGKRCGFSAPTPVAVLPAAPYYDELSYLDDYDAGSVSFTISSQEKSGADGSWTISGGVNMGLEQKGGAGAAGKDSIINGAFQDERMLSRLRIRYDAQNIETSVHYASDGGGANVVCAASPMTSYLYDVWVPEYTVTAKMREEYKKQTGSDCPFKKGSVQGGTFETYAVNNIYNPQYGIISVEQYNKAAKTYGTPDTPVSEIPMDEIYADYVPGAPDTYPKAEADLKNVASGSCRAGGTQKVSTDAAYGFSVEDDQKNELKNGFSLDFSPSLDYMASTKVGLFTSGESSVQGSQNPAISSGASWIASNRTGKALEASLTGLPQEASAYVFDATPALWRTTALSGADGDGRNPYVFGFLADGADTAPPTVPDMWVYDTQLERLGVGARTSYITLCWDDKDGTRPAAEYEVLQVDGNTAIPVGTSKTNMLTVEKLLSGQPFTFRLRAKGAGGEESILGRPLQAASQPKEQPAIKVQPQNVSANVGDSATFNVDAQPGIPDGTLYYQWQRFELSPNSLLGSWKNLTEHPVEGKTSYTLENVQEKDNNAKVRVVVYQTPTVGGICPMVCSQEAGLAVGPDANECTLQLSLQSSLMDYNTGHDTTFSVTDNTDGWPIVISGLPKGDLKGQKLYLLFVDETGTAVLDQIYIEVLAGPIVTASYYITGLFNVGQDGQPALQEGRIQMYAIFSGSLDLSLSDPDDPSSPTLADSEIIERLKNFLQTGDPSVWSTALAPRAAGSMYLPCYATAVMNYHSVDEDINSVEMGFETGRGRNSPLNIRHVTRATPEFELLPAEVDGGRFLGWYADAGHTTGVSSIGPASLSSLPPVLYAAYEDTSYSITYHLDGGTNDPLNPDSYTIVSPSIGLRAPQKPGYRFTGWFTDAGLKTPVKVIPHGSEGKVELYAGWELINYHVYYTAGAGKVPGNNPQTYTILDAVSPAPPVYGEENGAWYTDSLFSGAFSGLPVGSTGTLVLYGKAPKEPDTPPTKPEEPGTSPTEPEKPVTPPAKPGEPGTQGSIKTGDDSTIWPYLVLMAGTGAVIIIIWRNRRKF